MKRSLAAILALSVFICGCATVQSIVRSTFPYTATLIVPASGRTNTSLSATSSASSFDQIFTGPGTNTSSVKEVRIASAKLESSNPSNQNLGVFKTINLYISRADGSSEIKVASRNDISSTAGNSLVLDIDNSRFLDDYIKGSSVRIRMEYVLRDQLSVDASIRASIGFSTSPASSQ